LREEAFRDGGVEIGGGADGGEEHHQGNEMMFQRDVERAAIATQQRLEEALDDAVEPAVVAMIVAEEARAHHRRERQRDHRGHHHADRHRHGELTEQAAHDATHQQQRDEHRDQRQRDGDDGEADLAGALHCRLGRRHAILYMAVDVFQHDNRVIDHEADGDGHGHQ
jgi:hypothetical protein